MNEDQNNDQPADPFLPQQPQELPPLPSNPADFATGTDQDAGQAGEVGQLPLPPAPVVIGGDVPPRLPTTISVANLGNLYSLDSGSSSYGTVDYSGPDSDTPKQPQEFPPLPERPDTVRQQTDSLPPPTTSFVGSADAYRFIPAIHNLADRDHEFREEILRVLDKMSLTIATQTSQIGVLTRVLDTTRGELMEVQRWVQSWTGPGIRTRGY